MMAYIKRKQDFRTILSAEVVSFNVALDSVYDDTVKLPGNLMPTAMLQFLMYTRMFLTGCLTRGIWKRSS